jgi:hypothetical protein
MPGPSRGVGEALAGKQENLSAIGPGQAVLLLLLPPARLGGYAEASAVVGVEVRQFLCKTPRYQGNYSYRRAAYIVHVTQLGVLV